jgi:peptidoglycan/LPS O-acetylase OafA/YrhL
MPGLDGLRAIAVLAVIAYHLGFSWAPGGLLGVGIFFTLSGYLISDLLLAQLRGGGIKLGEFWQRRARRLLPALFLMLVIVAAWVAIAGPAQPTQFREAMAAAALYVANWQLIFQHVSYFSRFGPPSPLGHLWSLGIEEQFYIVWPLLLMLGARLLKESSSGVRPRLAGVTLLLATGSALEMALLYHPSFDPSRVYYGTDTRAFELLIGAALAMVWPSATLRREIAVGAVRVLDGVGVACLIGIFVMIWRVGEFSPFLYRGGFVLLSLLTALLVATLAHPACRLGGALGSGVLRWIGVRSYGIYLWHFPIIVLTTPSGAHGVNLLRAALQVAATLCVAALSWRFVEQPIRHGALGRFWRRLSDGELRAKTLPREGWAALGVSVVVLAFAGVGLAGASLGRKAQSGLPPGGNFVYEGSRGLEGGSGKSSSAGGGDGSYGGQGQTSDDGDADGSSGNGSSGIAGASKPQSKAEEEASLVSSCHSVIHIGDSTSEGLVSHDYLPDPKHRIEAQYERVGVTVQHYEISGARSIVERYEDQPNAYEVASDWKHQGYHGCWVLALGTNDAADVAVGSKVGMPERIDRMMAVIGKEPVLWVNVKSLLSSGPYAEQYMQRWDEALVKACKQYPTMHIFDWSALVKNEWFIEDGIHFDTPGYAARARLIAQALARAFPASREESSCVVR